MDLSCPLCNRSYPEGSGAFCPTDGAHLISAVEREQDPFVGRVLDGKYHLLRRLGQGGMAVVYEGRQAGMLSRAVAIKVMDPLRSGDAEMIRRFRQEAAAVCRLRNQHTVTLYDGGRTPDGLLYHVMELLHGQTVKQVIATQGALAPRRAVSIAAQVCDSLAEAHHCDIIHRDVTPANIMLVERDQQPDFAIVLDFGIAKIPRTMRDAGRTSVLSGPIGTAKYMSPEQTSGGKLTPASDVYSLGVVLYEMLVGRVPFDAQSAPQIERMHREEDVPPLELPAEPDLAARLDAVLRRALAKSDQDRYASAGEFKEALLATIGASSGIRPLAAPLPPARVLPAPPLDEPSGGAGPNPTLGTLAKDFWHPGPEFDEPSPSPELPVRRRWGLPLFLGLLGLAVVGSLGMAFSRGWLDGVIGPSGETEDGAAVVTALPERGVPSVPSPAASVAQPVEQVLIELQSAPPGARVWRLSGEARTGDPLCTTPCRFLFPRGAHPFRVQLEKEGFLPGDREEVRLDSSRTFKWVLRSASRPERPAGAATARVPSPDGLLPLLSTPGR